MVEPPELDANNTVITTRAERDPAKRHEMIRWYIDGGYKERGDVVPTIAGAGVMLRAGRQQMYDWANNDHVIAELYVELKSLQEAMLINGALMGLYNQSITKLLLATHHGYSDKVDVTTLNISADISDPEASRRIAYALQAMSPATITLGQVTTNIVPTALFADNPTDTED